MMLGEKRKYDTSRRKCHCAHCGKYRLNRRAGLCWTCAMTPAVSALYPSESSPTGVGATNAALPLPELPTRHRPGTVGKLYVMRQRLERGEHLHHPDDPQL